MKGKLAKKVISELPKFIKYPIYRTKLNLPSEIPPELQFKLISSKEELIKSCRILHDCYVEMKYMKEDQYGLRLTPYHLLPSTLTAVALWEGQVIATMSVVRDNPMGLPMDKVYDLSPLRKNGKVLGEVSGLAIDPKFRGSKGGLFHHLIRFLWNYSKTWHGLDYYVIAVNPSMSDFYEAFYLFEPMVLGHVVDGYDFANGATAVALKMPIQTSYEIINSVYKNKPDTQNLYNFMTKPKLPCEIIPQKEYYTITDNYLNQFTFKDIYNTVNDFDSRFDDKTKKIFSTVYGFKSFEDLVEGKKASRLRHETRALSLLVSDKSEEKKMTVASVKDISRNGLKVVVDGHVNESCSLTVAIGPNKKSNIIAEPIWVNPTGEVGMKIISSDNSWKSMHNAIDQKILSTLPESMKKLSNELKLSTEENTNHVKDHDESHSKIKNKAA